MMILVDYQDLMVSAVWRQIKQKQTMYNEMMMISSLNLTNSLIGSS